MQASSELPLESHVQVAPAWGEALSAAALAAPVYDPISHYDPAVQQAIFRAVRDHAGEAYEAVINAIRRPLAQEPHVVRLRGLSFDAEHRLFVALSCGLGSLEAPPYKPPRTQIVCHIHPSTDRAGDASTKTENEWPHSDCANHPEPANFITMACVRPDPQGGGQTVLITAGALRRALIDELGESEVCRIERTPVPWKRRDDLGGGVFYQPILLGEYVRWHRRMNDLALEALDEAGEPEVVRLLDSVERVVRRAPDRIELLLAAGDFLVADNLRTLHARTPLSSDYHSSERLMLRGWVRCSRGAEVS